MDTCGMKRGSIRHPKTIALARALHIPAWSALGLLDALLDWTYEFALEGNVGRFTNQEIADGIGWEGDADWLIAALITTHWLDECANHRLLIHDLKDHADRVWQQKLARNERTFAVRNTPVEATVSPQRVLSEATVSTPIRPGQARSDQVRRNRAPAPGADAPTMLGFEQFYDAYPKKRHRPAAERAWRAVHGATHFDAIMAGLDRWTASAQWVSNRIEDPATFLNQRQWEDEPAPAASHGDDLATMVAEVHRRRSEHT